MVSEGWTPAPCDYDNKLYCIKKHLAFKVKVLQNIEEAKYRVGHALGIRLEIDLEPEEAAPEPVNRNNHGTMIYLKAGVTRMITSDLIVFYSLV